MSNATQKVLVKLKSYSAGYLLSLFKEFRNELNISTSYSDELVTQAIEHHQKRNLRFNRRTGVTSDRDGENSRFSEGHYQPFEFDEKGALFDLMGDVYNSASRAMRGYAM